MYEDPKNPNVVERRYYHSKQEKDDYITFYFSSGLYSPRPGGLLKVAIPKTMIQNISKHYVDAPKWLFENMTFA